MKVSTMKKGLKVFADDLSLTKQHHRKLIGTLEALEGEAYFKIQPAASSIPYQWLPQCWIESVNEEGIYLNKTEDEIKGGAFDSPPPM